MKRGYARSEARNQELRERLEPLKPGERPTSVTVAVVLASVLATANLVLLLAGWEVRGQQPQIAGVLIFAGLMIAAAIGMYRMQYWAVLGFEALLGISIVFAALSLLVASNLQGAILSALVVLGAGTLFWFLVRAMARIQMPERPSRRSS